LFDILAYCIKILDNYAMTESGVEQKITPTASNGEEQFSLNSNFPEELKDAAYQPFEDGKTGTIENTNWIYDHFISTNPEFPGNIILLYDSRNTSSPSYEVLVTGVENDPGFEERIFIQIDQRETPPRIFLGRITLPKQSSDQNPSDQQL
jgi:hypothetical protein